MSQLSGNTNGPPKGADADAGALGKDVCWCLYSVSAVNGTFTFTFLPLEGPVTEKAPGGHLLPFIHNLIDI